MGDMNDDPQDASMSKCLGAKRWQKDVGDGDLWNPWWNVLASGTGTLSYQGSWNLFDQIILSPSLIRPQKGTLGYQDCEVFRRNYLIQKKDAIVVRRCVRMLVESGSMAIAIICRQWSICKSDVR